MHITSLANAPSDKCQKLNFQNLDHPVQFSSHLLLYTLCYTSAPFNTFTINKLKPQIPRNSPQNPV
jgi:hypothetical protein